jgi:hypothetical protein
VELDPIPTISFVSFWAGLLQACALVSNMTDPSNISVFPFALGEESPIVAVSPVANPACPIACAASKSPTKS